MGLCLNVHALCTSYCCVTGSRSSWRWILTSCSTLICLWIQVGKQFSPYLAISGWGSTWKTTIPGQIIWIHAFKALIFFSFVKKWPKISFPSHILHLQMILHFSHKASLGYNIVKDFLHKFNVKAITSTKNKVKLLRIETPITIPFLKEHSKPQWFKQ